MYFFNKNLLKNLPYMLGIKQKEFKERTGVPYTTYRRWLECGVGSMDSLTGLINRLHLSFADFIITGKYPAATQPKEFYVISEDVWRPVKWMPNKITSLYGEKGLTDIPSKFALSKKLGHSSYQKLDRWILGETPMPVEDFLLLVNTLQIDARIFIDDPNKEIVKPVFEWEKSLESARIGELESEIDKLRRELLERDKRILKLNKDLALARKELSLRKVNPTSQYGTGFVAEGYRSFLAAKRGYVFHKELWRALPSVFDFTDRGLCLELGIPLNSFSVENVKVETGIKVCNYLRMSFTHLLRPISEPSIIRDKGYYAISPKLFKPIENQLYNLRYVIQKDTFGLQVQDLTSVGIHWYGKESFMKENGRRSMMVTLADICTEFNIPPSVFVHDPNKQRAAYSVSQNETLIRNCVKMGEIIANLKQENKELKEKLMHD